jgi:dipeptidyl aminopeptidase/acylaminoacyl peptidase
MTTGVTGARRALVADDLLKLKVITDAQIAPDGSQIAYVVKTAALDRNEYDTAIIIHSTADGSERTLTTTPGRASAPLWSPDGAQLAYLAEWEGRPQLHVVVAGGGEPRRLTGFAAGVSSPAWSPDGARIAVLSATGSGAGTVAQEWPGGTIRHITDTRYRFDVVGYTDGKVNNIWIVPVAGGEPWQLTARSRDVAAPAWSPDGRQIAFVSTDDAIDIGFHSQLYITEVSIEAAGESSRGPRQISVGTEAASAPAWSPDGRRVAYIGRREGAPAGGNANIFLAATTGDPKTEALTADWDRSVGTSLFSDTWSSPPPSLFWSPDGAAVLCTACDEGRVSLFRAGANGVELVIGGDRIVALASASADGSRLAFASGNFTNPSDLYLCDGNGGGERRLTALNAELLGKVTLGTPEPLPFTSFDSRFEVDAWLLRPTDYRDGEQRPLVQIIHGGPHSIFGHTFFFDMQLWANQGWNVLFVNPRASQGYGEAFATANLADWGGADWREQEAALDLAIARGGVDPERLAVTGLSYGGFMTNWIVGQTDRYKVAASENGICNLISFYTTSDIGWFWMESEWGDRPVWSNLDYYMAHSPISYIEKMRTPIQFLQAEGDWRCPIEQGEQLYTALSARGVATEMIRFPGDSHTLLSTGKPRSRLERRRHTLRWFQAYLDTAAAAE